MKTNLKKSLLALWVAFMTGLTACGSTSQVEPPSTSVEPITQSQTETAETTAFNQTVPTDSPSYSTDIGDLPVYSGEPYVPINNKVANGVQMEAISVEDRGEGIEFNVFCYNVQPGITIDYATGESHEDGTNTTASSASNNTSSSSTQTTTAPAVVAETNQATAQQDTSSPTSSSSTCHVQHIRLAYC